jgi:hypothetical protein
MDTDVSIWKELIEYARWSPSPHNVQPWKVRVISGTVAQVFYDPTRLLRDTDPTSCFTIVGLAMFIECLNIAAHARGLELEAKHESEEHLDYSTKQMKLFATLTLNPRKTRKPDFDPELIKRRKTSRLQYVPKPVAPNVMDSLAAMASQTGQTFTYTSEPTTLHVIVDLNRATVFLDMDNDKARMELGSWIRTRASEAAGRRDGLWSRCMRFPGWMMRTFFFHHERLAHPQVRKVIGWVYRRSMKGTSTVAWLSGRFETRQDWVRSGILLQRLWLEMTKHDVYLHPFGSVITNEVAHAKFIEHIGFREQDEKVWLLMRMGYSQEPPRSYRLTTDEILL